MNLQCLVLTIFPTAKVRRIPHMAKFIFFAGRWAAAKIPWSLPWRFDTMRRPAIGPTQRFPPHIMRDTFSCRYRLKMPHSSPIAVHSSRLMANVAHGKPLGYFSSSDTVYRSVPPTKLPAPTKRMFLHIYYYPYSFVTKSITF